MIFIVTVAYICNKHTRHIETNVVYRWTQCNTIWITLLHRHIHTKSLGERTVFTMYVEEFSHIHVVAKVLCPWDKTLTNVNIAAHKQSQKSDSTWFFLWWFVSTPPLHTGKSCSQQTAVHLPRSYHHCTFRDETKPPKQTGSPSEGAPGITFAPSSTSPSGCERGSSCPCPLPS